VSYNYTWYNDVRCVFSCHERNFSFFSLIGSVHVSQQSKMPTMQVNDGPVEVDMYQKISQIDTWCHWKTGFGAEIDAGSESSTKGIQSFNQYVHDSRELIFELPAAIPGYLPVCQHPTLHWKTTFMMRSKLVWTFCSSSLGLSWNVLLVQVFSPGRW